MSASRPTLTWPVKIETSRSNMRSLRWRKLSKNGIGLWKKTFEWRKKTSGLQQMLLFFSWNVVLVCLLYSIQLNSRVSRRWTRRRVWNKCNCQTVTFIGANYKIFKLKLKWKNPVHRKHIKTRLFSRTHPDTTVNFIERFEVVGSCN